MTRIQANNALSFIAASAILLGVTVARADVPPPCPATNGCTAAQVGTLCADGVSVCQPEGCGEETPMTAYVCDACGPTPVADCACQTADDVGKACGTNGACALLDPACPGASATPGCVEADSAADVCDLRSSGQPCGTSGTCVAFGGKFSQCQEAGGAGGAGPTVPACTAGAPALAPITPATGAGGSGTTAGGSGTTIGGSGPIAAGSTSSSVGGAAAAGSGGADPGAPPASDSSSCSVVTPGHSRGALAGLITLLSALALFVDRRRAKR